jgi:hypothetical protein
VVISGLPDASSPELNGTYGHELKNIALDGSDKLYVSIASTCNVCTSDTQSNPVRAAIYVYNADGSSGRLFARGLRNAEGLAMIPGTNTLWVVVNNRDDIAYPFNDGSGNYGRVFSGYVDDHPPDEFTRVRDGGNYGWPFCNPNPDTPSGLVDMPFDRDYQMNQTGAVDCGTMDRINHGIQAHSAPLGLTFFQNTNAPVRRHRLASRSRASPSSTPTKTYPSPDTIQYLTRPPSTWRHYQRAISTSARTRIPLPSEVCGSGSTRMRATGRTTRPRTPSLAIPTARTTWPGRRRWAATPSRRLHTPPRTREARQERHERSPSP